MGWKDTIQTEAPKKKTGWKDTIVDEKTGEAPEVEKPWGDEALETAHDMMQVMPQGVTTWADEIEGGVRAGAKKLMGSEDPYMDLYEAEVKPIRDRISLARDRSPWATTASELGTGVMSSFIPGLGVGKLTGAAGMIGRGALEGLGTAEDKASLEGLTHTAIGGTVGGVGALVSGALRKGVSMDPNKIRANVLGAGTSEFKDVGIKERGAIAKELKDMGLFGNLKTKFDATVGKWIPQGKSLENLESPARDKLLTRLDDGMETIQGQKMSILGKHADDVVPMADLEDDLVNMAHTFSQSAGSGMSDKKAFAENIIEKVLVDLEQDRIAHGSGETTVALLEKAKHRIAQDVSHYGKALSATPDEAKLYKEIYKTINERLRKALGNTKYAKFNDMQQKILTTKADIAKALASEDAAKATAGWGGWPNKIINATIGSPDAGLGMANIAEHMQRPGIKQLVKGGVAATAEAPFQAMRQFDPSIPNANDVYVPMGEPTVEEPEEAPMVGKAYDFSGTKKAFSNQFNPVTRKYQSVEGTDMTPMELAKARLPRTTQGLLENKEMVIAKMAQTGVPDDMIDAFTQAMNEDPEAVESIAALAATQFPNLFEKSKYKMFDGKILDPNERAKAADATSKRDDMGSLQKAKIINELNKSGKWLGE